MTLFPIWIRLTTWYVLILAVILSLFGPIACFAMRSSVHRTVDEEPRTRMERERRLIERTARNGDVRGELWEHSELAAGALLHASDQQGNWLCRPARKYMGRSTCKFLRVSGNWRWIDETA